MKTWGRGKADQKGPDLIFLSERKKDGLEPLFRLKLYRGVCAGFCNIQSMKRLSSLCFDLSLLCLFYRPNYLNSLSLCFCQCLASRFLYNDTSLRPQVCLDRHFCLAYSIGQRVRAHANLTLFPPGQSESRGVSGVRSRQDLICCRDYFCAVSALDRVS